VHECAVPISAPALQKKLAGQRLLVATAVPGGQKKPYGQSTIVDGVVPLKGHTLPAGHGEHGVAPPMPI
jgi:hypothetical protein